MASTLDEKHSALSRQSTFLMLERSVCNRASATDHPLLTGDLILVAGPLDAHSFINSPFILLTRIGRLPFAFRSPIEAA